MGFGGSGGGGGGGGNEVLAFVRGLDGDRYDGLSGSGNTLTSFAAANAISSFQNAHGMIITRGENESGSGGFPQVGIRVSDGSSVLFDYTDSVGTDLTYRDTTPYSVSGAIAFDDGDVGGDAKFSENPPVIEVYDESGGGGSSDALVKASVAVVFV